MGRGRAPCCEKIGLNKGSWTPEEDMRLMAYIHKYGHANWRALPKQAGLLRCGKSCRLRWINYLRPDIKRGNFAKEEEDTIIKLHGLLGNKWSKIASCLPGRTDNEIKNVWNTHLKKRLSPKDRKPTVQAQDKSEDPPSSPSSTTTASFSCCDQGESKTESEHTDTNIERSKEPIDAVDQDSDKIEIPIEPNLDFWEMLDDVYPPEPSNLSPCSSSSNMVVLNDPMEEIPDIAIEPELWSIIDNNLDMGAIACHGQNSTNCTNIEEERSDRGDSERWLAYLEKELELWGESDENKQVLNTEVEGGDPVTSYFQRTTSSSPFPLDDLLY